MITVVDTSHTEPRPYRMLRSPFHVAEPRGTASLGNKHIRPRFSGEAKHIMPRSIDMLIVLYIVVRQTHTAVERFLD